MYFILFYFLGISHCVICKQHHHCLDDHSHGRTMENDIVFDAEGTGCFVSTGMKVEKPEEAKDNQESSSLGRRDCKCDNRRYELPWAREAASPSLARAAHGLAQDPTTRAQGAAAMAAAAPHLLLCGRGCLPSSLGRPSDLGLAFFRKINFFFKKKKSFFKIVFKKLLFLK